jgi:hypothetical protein
MTSIAQDAINGTATKSATLLTEYMPDGPAVVINFGTDRVWLGTSSAVSSSTGVPCEAEAFVVWTEPGQLWVVLDSAAASSSAAVQATTRLASWQASPAAIGDQVATFMTTSGLAAQIGVQVAEQANALGIPAVFQGSTLQRSVAVGAVTSYEVPFDLSAYASITVSLSLVPTGQQIGFAWIDQAGGTVGVDTHYFQCTGTNGPANTSGISLTLPVESSTLRILLPGGTNTGTFATRITTYASNRPIALTLGGLDNGVDLVKTQSFVNGTPVALGTVNTNGGLHWARMLTNSTGAGYFGYSLGSSTGGTSPNLYVWKNAAGADTFQQIALPPGCVGLVFLPTVTGTYTAEMTITPAI